MSYFKLYESAGFTVTDFGYGVEIQAEIAGVITFVQGDDATQLRDEIEGAARRGGVPSEITERTDARLSEYFTDYGAEARQLIGERE